MREIKNRNAANIILYISSEMGLSDRTGETGLARFRSPFLRAPGPRAERGPAYFSACRRRLSVRRPRCTEMTGGRRTSASRSRGREWESEPAFGLRSMRPLPRRSMRPSRGPAHRRSPPARRRDFPDRSDVEARHVVGPRSRRSRTALRAPAVPSKHDSDRLHHLVRLPARRHIARTT